MYVEGDWGRHFAALDYPAARPAAPRADRAVWWLQDGLVATVWFGRPASELRLLGDFLDDVAHAGLPFAVPRHLAVDVGPDGLAWTLEPELDGDPLAVDVPGTSPELSPAIVQVLLDVHGALSAVAPSPGLRRMTVLGEDQALLAGRTGFPDALAALVERGRERAVHLLRVAVPGLADLISAVTEGLRAIEDSPEGLVHGALRAPHVLVDGHQIPTAVVGFGVFSTIGDPTFDAAVTASVCDTSGPRARHNRDLLDAALSDYFAYAPDRLSLYRLAYALATAGAPDARTRTHGTAGLQGTAGTPVAAGTASADQQGVDDHIRWCRDILTGPDADRAFG